MAMAQQEMERLRLELVDLVAEKQEAMESDKDLKGPQLARISFVRPTPPRRSLILFKSL